MIPTVPRNQDGRPIPGPTRTTVSLITLASLLALSLAIPLNIQASRQQESLPSRQEQSGTGSRVSHSTIPAGEADGLLCASDSSQGSKIKVLHTKDLAIAADESGHFTLYERPDPRTGRPTSDSNELLLGCAPELAHYNLATVQANGQSKDLSPDTVSAKTRLRKTEASGQELVTEHELSQGLTVAQSLRLSEDRGKPSLVISHKLTNHAGVALDSDFRQLLTPALPREDQAEFKVPGLKGRLHGQNVAYETELAQTRDEIPESVLAPRPAVATDSTSVWKPAGTFKPSHITFAGWTELSSAAIPYKVRLAWNLPRNSAMSVEWRDLNIPKDGSKTLSQAYGPAKNNERSGR